MNVYAVGHPGHRDQADGALTPYHVPPQPVSHGCVRIPMDIAVFFHTLVPTPGTPVYIRG